jgi:hyaluronoglucosaminidase
LEIGDAGLADLHFAPACDLTTEFEVDLPAVAAPFPVPVKVAGAEPGFKIRGTKGWAWTPEQYLTEIPYLVKAKLNFMMNCYTSMFSSLDPFVNTWWEPLPEAKKKGFEEVVSACRKNGIDFCFAVHPQLFSERPLALDSPEDFEKLWQHYAWMQSLGVTWFSVSYDDIGVEGWDKSVLGAAHARLVNKLLGRLREKTPGARMIFCPVYYMGCGDSPEASAYLGALGRVLKPDVYVFWTGDGVVTTRITMACAETYRQIVGHRLIIWDNYPVNDRHPTLHLGPVTGRDSDLPRIADGYMSNPLCPQNEINRLPLFTCADYAWNPAAYDPLRSIGQAIIHLAETPAQRQALKSLVEFYPGMLIYGDINTSFNPIWERFQHILQQPGPRTKAEAFVARLENAEKQLAAAFPDRYGETKKTIRGHIARMKNALPTR